MLRILVGSEMCIRDRFQIDYYLKATGVNWGIASNGRAWRLVQRDSSYKLDVYFEVDVLDALNAADDSRALAAALVSCAQRPLEPPRAAVTDFFDAHLSIPAVGRQALNIYQSLHRRRAGRQPDGAR